tara:strand:+ start:35390 stop:35845 length:456 start_codon:yes stop_codon:yes gene_type:complete
LIKVPEKKPINELIEDFIILSTSNLFCNSPIIVPTKVPKIIPINPRKINPTIEPTKAPFTPLFDPPYFFTIYDGNKLSIKLIKRLNRNVIIKKVKLNSIILKDFRIMKLIHEIIGPGSKGKKQKMIPTTDIIIAVNIIKVFNFFIKFSNYV